MLFTIYKYSVFGILTECADGDNQGFGIAGENYCGVIQMFNLF
eukprot:COSAG05_NODE_21394_length_272_cov_0.601156_1_plen_42_part_01